MTMLEKLGRVSGLQTPDARTVSRRLLTIESRQLMMCEGRNSESHRGP